MFSFLKRKRQLGKYLGVGFHQDGISLALVSQDKDQAIRLEHLEYRRTTSVESSASEIRAAASELGLKGLPTVFVLDHLHYTLMQVEVPEVSAEELKNAVRWRIKDLIDFHVDDAVIDLIMLPESKRAGAPRLMYVVAARAKYVQQVTEQLESAGLDILAIDVTELAIRNMTYADAELNRAEAVLFLSNNVSLIAVCDNGCLFLSRHINIDFSRLQNDAPEGRIDVMDMLSLEVQRSMDYFESQFAYGSTSKLHVVSENPAVVDEFIDVASSYLTVPLKRLSALETIQGLDQYDPRLVAACLPTIGGAIREYAWNT